MAKTSASELQKAADAVRLTQTAVEKFEKIEASLQRDLENLEKEILETKMNLEDTRSLLRAQREKLGRELNVVSGIVDKSFPYRTLGYEGAHCAKVSR